MKKLKKLMAAMTVLALLWGCQSEKPASVASTAPAASTISAETMEPEIVETTAPDGNPEDVTCKGSYTGTVKTDAVVARIGDAELTNGQLQSWYWAAVAQAQQTMTENAPDFHRPLDAQSCSIDSSVSSWQQYFLQQALDTWHMSQALYLQAQVKTIPTEEEYQPSAKNHANCMTGMPATQFLYGEHKTYQPNSMHQAYLDGLPQRLESLAQAAGYADGDAMAQAMGSTLGELQSFAWLYNYGYTYLTFLSYDIAPTAEEGENWRNSADYEAADTAQTGDSMVDVRQVLLIPESDAEGDVEACRQKAESLLKTWKAKTRETDDAFAILAHDNSQDAGTAASGGAYRNLQKGQLPESVETWCFAPERKAEDTTILETEQGIHILFLTKRTPLETAQAQKDMTIHLQQDLLADAKAEYPMEVDYSAIALSAGEGTVSYDDVLYPDIAHERYPEVPLYLQQDYPLVWYGSYRLSSNGCGITTFAMLTTYMSDEEWTPPEMCARYGNYSFSTGTDGMIFLNEPAKFDYFFKERVFENTQAMQALKDGYIVVSIQHKGYWTRAAHYILLEKLTEDGMIQVRDSNIANYARLPRHVEDKHKWNNITEACDGYWVFEKKVTRIDACSRCGTPDSQTQLVEDYICHKCQKALTRRNVYLMSAE